MLRTKFSRVLGKACWIDSQQEKCPSSWGTLRGEGDLALNQRVEVRLVRVVDGHMEAGPPGCLARS